MDEHQKACLAIILVSSVEKKTTSFKKMKTMGETTDYQTKIVRCTLV